MWISVVSGLAARGRPQVTSHSPLATPGKQCCRCDLQGMPLTKSQGRENTTGESSWEVGVPARKGSLRGAIGCTYSRVCEHHYREDSQIWLLPDSAAISTVVNLHFKSVGITIAIVSINACVQ